MWEFARQEEKADWEFLRLSLPVTRELIPPPQFFNVKYGNYIFFLSFSVHEDFIR